jgi:hypothetical protein
MYEDVKKAKIALIKRNKYFDRCSSLVNVLGNNLYFLNDPDGEHIILKAECRKSTNLTFRQCRKSTKISTINGEAVQLRDGEWGKPYKIKWAINALCLAKELGNLRRATQEETHIWDNQHD